MSNEINLEVKCQLSELEIELTKDLLTICYSRVFPNGSMPLQKVMVVEDDMIEKEVNSLIVETGENRYYKNQSSSAVAVPLKHNGRFYSIIIYGKSVIPNNPEGYDFSNISTFLEELLHVQFYEEIQEKMEFNCNTIAAIIAKKMIDEYVVNRRKYLILIEMCGELGYDKKLIPRFDCLDEKLLFLVSNAAAKLITIDDACEKLFTILYREYFELLTRYSVAKACINDVPSIPVENYPFLNDVAYKYWEQIHACLKMCFNDIENVERYTKTINDIVADFMKIVGVTYKEIPNGFYYHFDNSFLRQYRYTRGFI